MRGHRRTAAHLCASEHGLVADPGCLSPATGDACRSASDSLDIGNQEIAAALTEGDLTVRTVEALRSLALGPMTMMMMVMGG